MSEQFRNEVIEQLRSSGADIKKPHDFDFYLYLPTEKAAKLAANKANENKFEARISPAATRSDWLCLASVTVVPETAALSEIEDFFEQVAAALEGQFDGWEAKIVR